MVDTFPRSNFIVDRAREFLENHRGRAQETALLTHVFGQRGRVDVWRALLRSALDNADGFVLRADETWELPRPAPPGLDAYSVLDVETTGLDPRRQRIIEIALHRYRDGSCVGRWSTTLNPGRRVPSYVRQLTGLTEDGLADAPTFADIAIDLLQHLEGEPLVGHNVAFDIAFVNAEFARLDRPPLTNASIDTLTLAVALIPRLRRPNLDAVADALGVMAPRRHRADADATITAACFSRMLKRAADRGISTWDDLDALANGSAAALPLPARPARRGWSVLDRALLDDIPARPGVYLMRDSTGSIVYIGKAKNLRNRVRSYFSQPLGLTRKMDGLLETVKQIDVEVVGSELEALLLESRLIKQELPRYNVQLRYYDQYPFIKVDINTPYPRVFATRAIADDGARYFGPFRNASAVQTTIDMFTDLFPIRTCVVKVSDPGRRWRPCLRLDFGRCLGPCVGRTDVDTYKVLIDDIVAYLEGRREPLVNRLWEQLRAASDKLDFERAGRLRDAIRQVNEVAISQLLLAAAVARTHVLIVLPSAVAGAREVLVVRSGQLAAQVRLPAEESIAVSAARLHTIWNALPTQPDSAQPVDQKMIDEIAIIGRWLYQNEQSRSIVALPAQPDSLAAWLTTVQALPALDHLGTAEASTPDPPNNSSYDPMSQIDSLVTHQPRRRPTIRE